MIRKIALLTLLALLAGCDDPISPGGDESETGSQAPVLRKLAPDSGLHVYPGSSVVFEVEATDPDDGDLTGGSVVWMNGAGDTLGTGTELVALAPRPDSFPGSWDITVKAADGDGAVSFARYSITVETRVLWKRTLGGTLGLDLLALAPGGPVYVSSGGATLSAFTVDGTKLWDQQTKGSLWNHAGGITVGPDGTAYVVDGFGSAYAFSPTGTQLWKKQYIVGADPHGRFALAEDGSLYLNGDGDGLNGSSQIAHVLRLEPGTGDVLWEVFGESVSTDVLIGPTGAATIVVQDTLVNVDPSGNVRRRHIAHPPESDAGRPVYSFAAASLNGDIHYNVAFPLGEMVAIDSTGSLVFESGGRWNHAAVGGGGTVYRVGFSGVAALQPDGSPLWERPLPTPSGNAHYLAIIDGGRLHVGSGSALYGLSIEDGSTLWRVPVDGMVSSALAVAEDGTVYFVTKEDDESFLYAVMGDGPLDPDAPWPTWRADNQRTARVQG